MIGLSDWQNICRYQSQVIKRLRYQKKFKRFDTEDITEKLCNRYLTVEERCNTVVEYFWRAQRYYSTLGATRAYYPGRPSIYGAENDGIEGITRLMPLWATQVQRTDLCELEKEQYEQYLSESFINGTDPSHLGYWGDIGDRSTLICEAADVALALWLVKDSLWHNWSITEQEQILTWLKQVPYKKTADNNWHLFIVLVAKVVEVFEPDIEHDAWCRYERVKSFYLGDGCFRDGLNGEVDLYNAWGFHYALYWIDQIDSQFDREFIQSAICDYSQWFQMLFTENGFPLFGRSLCYKLALPAPLLAASDYDSERFPVDTVKAIFDAHLKFFINNGSLVQGRMSQGVFADDMTWLDPYSGPASAFWGTRSLVMFYYLNQNQHNQKLEARELPYRSQVDAIKVNAANFQISFDLANKIVSLGLLENDKEFNSKMLEFPSRKDRIRQVVYGIGQRPANNLQKAGVRNFSSQLVYYWTRSQQQNN